MNEPKQELIRYPASRLLDVAKALSSDIRLRILEALGERPMSVSQLAEALGAAQPTISINVQALEQAELVSCRQGSGREKICTASCRSVLLELPLRSGDALRRVEEIRMPIGLYSRCDIQAPCGMASREGAGLGSPDDPRVFICRSAPRPPSSGSPAAAAWSTNSPIRCRPERSSTSSS